MSIAVSTVVNPSRTLSVLIGTMALIIACVAITISTGYVGELTPSIRWPLGALVLFLSFFGFYHGVRTRKTIQLDISGTGQIRLLRVGCEPPCVGVKRPHLREIGELVRLLDNSTIWPHMLLLRFRAEDGRTIVVPVLPDSVDRDAFRALSVSCRWISGQNESPIEKIF